jgi:hypothetical protein
MFVFLGVPSQRVEGRLVIHSVEQDEHAFAWSITALFSAISATAADIISAIAAARWSRVALYNRVFRSKPRVFSSECLVPLCSRARIRTMGTLGRASGSFDVWVEY